MTQPSSAATSSVTGQITDEGLARLRATIGIAVPHTQPPHYLRPNADCFRHVAESYGDANPLWSDPEYAAKSVWGEPVAPPALVGGDTLIGEDEVSSLSDEDRALTKGDPLHHDRRRGSSHPPRSNTPACRHDVARDCSDEGGAARRQRWRAAGGGRGIRRRCRFPDPDGTGCRCPGRSTTPSGRRSVRTRRRRGWRRSAPARTTGE